MRIVAAPRDENDLLARMSEVQSSTKQQVTEIEIVAHGNPALCDDLSLDNAVVVGESLRRIRGIGDATAVYLSGCNTGLEFNGECLARLVADSFQAPVFGSRGYIVGTHAERNERCVASFTLDGILYHAYSGGIDADGDAVWKPFGAPSGRAGGEQVQIKIATSGFRAVNLADGEGENLVSAVEEIVRTPPASSARMRMAPDLTFAVRLADGEHVFELLAGGTVLRDPVTKHVWQFERGREILQSLLPFRKLPAA